MAANIFHLEPETPRDLDRLVASLEKAGILDPRVLEAVRAVPRERFVPPEWAERARGRSPDPAPLAVARHASDPAVVALLGEALQLDGTEKLLLVGAGYGYPAAIFSRLASRVVAVEKIADIAEQARANLARDRISNVQVVVGDGSAGWPDEAPFDAIAVCTLDLTLADSDVAQVEWGSQLREGGRLAVLASVLPLGKQEEGQVAVFVQRDGKIEGPIRLLIAKAA